MNVFAIRRDAVITAAWEIWTKNGLRLDEDMRRETVQDAVNNVYVEDMSDSEWLDATLKRLGYRR
jgi:hypothetical protein